MLSGEQGGSKRLRRRTLRTVGCGSRTAGIWSGSFGFLDLVCWHKEFSYELSTERLVDCCLCLYEMIDSSLETSMIDQAVHPYCDQGCHSRCRMSTSTSLEMCMNRPYNFGGMNGNLGIIYAAMHRQVTLSCALAGSITLTRCSASVGNASGKCPQALTRSAL